MIKEQPLVSVLCLCYNQSKFVVESLESIKNQTYKNIEVFVLDDCSQKDNSIEVIDNWIAQHPEMNITFIKHTENKGICKSLNELLALSKGKYLQLLALDDVILPWKIEKHVELLEKSTDKDAMVFTDAYLMDENSKLYQNRFIATHKNYLSINSGNFFSELLNGNFIPANTVLFKRDIVVKLNGWNEELPYEDYDMWLRMSNNGYDFIFDDELSCKYRLHETNTHKSWDLFQFQTFKMFMQFIYKKEVENMLRLRLDSSYRSKTLMGENQLYYSKVKPKNISDYCLKNNFPVTIYRILKFFKL